MLASDSENSWNSLTPSFPSLFFLHACSLHCQVIDASALTQNKILHQLKSKLETGWHCSCRSLCWLCWQKSNWMQHGIDQKVIEPVCRGIIGSTPRAFGTLAWPGGPAPRVSSAPVVANGRRAFSRVCSH